MMWGKLIKGILILALLFYVGGIEGRAEIAGDGALKNLRWSQIYEEPRHGGVVQSVCATEYYIITMENVADDPNVPDIISAYYRGSTDENGNPVTPYTLAKRVQEREWEHCNGMAYNPETNEIYVALYTNTIAENRGCLYVMDPETLDYKRTVKISGDYNILGIDYQEESKQYVIQTNSDGGYSFKILNEDFEVVEDLGEYAHTAKGDNFQDLAVSGDYILNFPLTLGMKIGDFIHMYSMSRREMVASEPLDFGFSGVTEAEPESLCELTPGVFLAVVNVETEDGKSLVRLYETLVPYNMTFEPVKNIAGSEPGKVTVKAPKEKMSKEEAGAEGNIWGSFSKRIKEGVDFSSMLESIKAKLAEKDIQLPAKFVLTFVIMTLAFLLVFLSIYAYVLRVRRERKRREKERKRRRRMALEAVN
ncbi:MAG: hypothetical protein HFH13_03910 [Dorea sp.]|nr:hypothetical protein [Dorea sp.]